MPRRDKQSLKALLSGMDLNRVDFVAAGANGEADILLWKAADTNSEIQAALVEAGRDAHGGEGRHVWVEDFATDWVVFSVSGRDLEKLVRHPFMFEEDGYTVTLGDGQRVARNVDFVPIDKQDQGADGVRKTKETTPMADETITQEQLDAAVAKAVEDATAMCAAQYEVDQAEFLKALEELDADPDPLKKSDLSDEAKAEIVKAREEAEEAKTEVAKLRDDALTAEVTEIAKGLPYIADDTEDLPGLLKAVREADEELGAQVESMLTKAQERIAKGKLFAELGHPGAIDVDNPGEGLLAKAAEYRAQDSSLSEGDAIAKARRENPDLRAAYDREQRQAARAR